MHVPPTGRSFFACLLILAPHVQEMCFDKHRPSHLKSELLGFLNLSEQTNPLPSYRTEPHSGLDVDDTKNNHIIHMILCA